MTTNKLLTPARIPAPSDDRRWKAEDALHVLTKADEYRKDRGLMADVRKLAQKKLKQLNGVALKRR